MCALVVADITAAVNFPFGYVTVAPGFVCTKNAVLPDCVAYTFSCSGIDM